MRSGSAPAWARNLAVQVCTEAGVTPPEVLRWRRAAREGATGLTNPQLRSIAVTAGRDEADARHTLLHELAHWITPEVRRRRHGEALHHGAAFYRTAIPLYQRHEPDLTAALRREAGHYPSVLRHAAAMGIDVEQLRQERRERRTAMSSGRGRWRVLVPEHPVVLVRDGRWYACATCGRRLVGRVLRRAARRGARDRHTLWTREPLEAAG